jgi:hypothetical protein
MAAVVEDRAAAQHLHRRRHSGKRTSRWPAACPARPVKPSFGGRRLDADTGAVDQGIAVMRETIARLRWSNLRPFADYRQGDMDDVAPALSTIGGMAQDGLRRRRASGSEGGNACRYPGLMALSIAW